MQLIVEYFDDVNNGNLTNTVLCSDITITIENDDYTDGVVTDLEPQTRS